MIGKTILGVLVVKKVLKECPKSSLKRANVVSIAPELQASLRAKLLSNFSQILKLKTQL